MIKEIKTIRKLFNGFLITLVTIASTIVIYENKSLIVNKINLIQEKNRDDSKYVRNQDIDWINELKNGGYIVFMRHAERDKWLDVGAYDGIELKIINTKDDFSNSGENEYFSEAVCLNKRGKVQSKMISQIFNFSKIKFDYISSSPICRSKQTALIISKKINDTNKILASGGFFSQDLNLWRNDIKNYLLEVPIIQGSNTLITAHGKMLTKEMFDNEIKSFKDGGPSFKIKEGGFYILSRDNGKLIFEKQFSNFQNFSKLIFKKN